MSITINDEEMSWNQGMTVRQMLDAMPGQLHMVVVRVNGKMVSRHDWDTATVPDGAKVEVVDIIAGG